MKSIILPVILICISCLIGAQETVDPFEPVEPKPIDRSKDKDSSEFIEDEMLKAFGEERLDKGTEKGVFVIRITVMRSFHSPLMLIWYPAEAGQKSLLKIKRLKNARNDEGRIYKGLDLNKVIKLQPAQEKLLRNMYTKSPLNDLPQPYWSPPALDGSMWIYESAGEDGSIVIARRNPIDPFIEGVAIKPERFSKEMQLTTFSMMLWALSGIDEEPY